MTAQKAGTLDMAIANMHSTLTARNRESIFGKPIPPQEVPTKLDESLDEFLESLDEGGIRLQKI